MKLFRRKESADYVISKVMPSKMGGDTNVPDESTD
jgi:hypothetical protein